MAICPKVSDSPSFLKVSPEIHLSMHLWVYENQMGHNNYFISFLNHFLCSSADQKLNAALVFGHQYMCFIQICTDITLKNVKIYFYIGNKPLISYMEGILLLNS